MPVTAPPRRWPSPACRAAGAALALVLALAPGCASRPRFVDERRAEPYAGLLARGAGLRVEERSADFPQPRGPAVRVAYRVVRTPSATPGPMVVLQPGVMADGSTWRFVAPVLAERHDLVLVDPPGTGRSDRPDPRALAADAYSPAWLARATLAVLLDVQRSEPAPRRLLLVGHSLGGQVTLRLLADPALRAASAGLLDRVERAALIARADLGLTDAGGQLRSLGTTTDLEVALGQLLGLARPRIDESVRTSVLDPGRDALGHEAERLAGVLCSADTRHAMQAMLLRFQPLDRCGRPDRAAIAPLLEQERAIRVPLLLLWGDRDATLPPATAEPLRERLTTERFELLAGKHSLHQERAADVAARLRAFFDEAPAAGAAGPAAAATP